MDLRAFIHDGLKRAVACRVIRPTSRFVSVVCNRGTVTMRSDDGLGAWQFAVADTPVDFGRKVARMVRTEFPLLQGVVFCKEKAA